MVKATALLAVLALCASAVLFLAGSSSMRRLELEGSYVKLGDNNGFGTNAAFIDKGNLPEGMHDNTRGALLVDGEVQKVAPEGGYITVSRPLGSNKVSPQQKAGVGDGVVHLSDNHGFGTNAGFLGQGDGEGTSVKAPAQMLAQSRLQHGRKTPARRNQRLQARHVAADVTRFLFTKKTQAGM